MSEIQEQAWRDMVSTWNRRDLLEQHKLMEMQARRFAARVHFLELLLGLEDANGDLRPNGPDPIGANQGGGL